MELDWALERRFNLTFEKREKSLLDLNYRISGDLTAGYLQLPLFCKNKHFNVMNRNSLTEVLVWG